MARRVGFFVFVFSCGAKKSSSEIIPFILNKWVMANTEDSMKYMADILYKKENEVELAKQLIWDYLSEESKSYLLKVATGEIKQKMSLKNITIMFEYHP
jgi:hypothetical protein